MSDTGIIQGDVNIPDLPPVNLPTFEAPPREPLRLTVRPRSSSGTKDQAPQPGAQKDGAWASGVPDFQPSQSPQAQGDVDGAWAALPDFSATAPKKDAAEKPAREIGAGQSGAMGAYDSASFGLAPAIEGAAEASGLDKGLDAYPGSNLIRPIVGAAKLMHNAIAGSDDSEVHAAYERGRKAYLANQDAAKEQHAHIFLAGQLAGALASPGFGAGGGATRAANALRGVGAGAVGGGLYGAGNEISEGGGLSEIAKSGARGLATGAALGGAVGTVLPRAAGPVTRGQRAAQTAEELGAPLPRGLASDSAAVNATTAKMRSIPIAGTRVSSAVDRVQGAAGHRIEEISHGMAGGATDRAAADTVIRPGLQTAIDANRTAIDDAYNGLRRQIDTRARFTMPRTDRALTGIMRDRAEAGHVNPAAGLEQFRNVADGATFNGAHRARVDAREAGNAVVPHPGYNAGDFNRLTRAMTADLRDMVQAAAGRNPTAQRAALSAFDRAEQQFGRLADQNALLNRLVNARGEGAIATLLGAAKEQGGNLRLLAQLRHSMDPQDFQQIGGTLLSELGHQNASGEFSLAKFSTNWDKVSDRAKAVLFSPQHLRDIENIAEMGMHIKGALRESNTSHTAGALILLDMARDALMLGVGIGTGAISAGAAMTGGLAAVPGVVLAHWLATPATAAAMSNWTRAYRAVTLNQPSPARIAAFNLATRNLANNIGVPVQKVMQSIQGRIASKAEPDREGDKAK